MPYIFLDESGQFSQNNKEKYFIVGSFTVDDPKRTEKLFRSWCTNRFSKKSRGQSEVKWSSPITDSQRLNTLKYISQLGIRIHYTYLLRKNIPREYWMKDKLQSGLLYTNIISETLTMYLPTKHKEFRVFCDERHLKGVKRNDFKNTITNRLLGHLPKKSIIQIEMIDSASNANIQIADWVSGALAWYHEGKPLGKEGFLVLKNSLDKPGKELFV